VCIERQFFITAVLAFSLFTASAVPQAPSSARTTDADSAAIESARRTRDESQLTALKTQLRERVSASPSDVLSVYRLALVKALLVDVYEHRKDKKATVTALDDAISSAERAVQLDESSSNAHSLLADLYGRKIGYSGIFAGPRLGPKVKAHNQRAIALDDNNPRAWASLGRQYLMAPAMFGGDAAKAIDSFHKSLALDDRQDDTWAWLALAYKKKGDISAARSALEKARSLNSESPFVTDAAASLSR